MTDGNPTDPLALLKATSIPELSPEEEAARRARIVARIEALRDQQSVLLPMAEPRLELLGAPVANTTEHPESGAAPAPSHRAKVVRWQTSAPWLAAALAAAAGIALWLRAEGPEPLLRVSSGEVLVQTSAGLTRLDGDLEWDEDEAVIATEEREATLVLPSRTSMHFERQSRAAVSRRARAGGALAPGELAVESVRLEHGTLTVEQSQPDATQELRVFTARADVVMRGSLFAVQISRSPEGDTRVVVRRGQARIRVGDEEQTIGAGRSWSSASLADAETAPSIAREDSAIEPGPASTADSRATTSVSGVGKASSSLAEQNRLFERAQAARRSGNSEEALRHFEALLRRYPGSEQAHNARVEHFRLLRALGRNDRARASAEAYLRAYPRGFAVAEARKLTR